ncbi:MAG: class I SAM-dependent methyltransferase [Clostridia bacterium]|nr:class I SAM-dependent methyltransferase [Clostridia bacterium]
MDVNCLLAELRAYAAERHIPVLSSDAAETLELWLRKKQPLTVLEIGTSIGTSGILCLAATAARLTTIEKDEDVFLKARENFARAGFCGGRAELINADCFETLALMSKKFDFVILDGPKGHTAELFELVYPMLNPGGTVFVDNINYHGKIKADGEVPHKHRTIVRNTRHFLESIAADSRVLLTIIENGDGIAVLEKVL